MLSQQLHFLRVDFINHLKSLDPATPPLFGKMNVLQMIEHMADSVAIANGRDKHDLHTPPERLQAMKDFVLSRKEFRPNTRNVLLPDEPLAARLKDKAEAITWLEDELTHFVAYYGQHPGARIMNPFFGELNFDEWIILLHKHAIHHLKQFGVEVSAEVGQP